MTFSPQAFSLIAQRDSKVGRQIAEDSKYIALLAAQDSKTMKTIAIVTLVFLPATLTTVPTYLPTYLPTRPLIIHKLSTTPQLNANLLLTHQNRESGPPTSSTSPLPQTGPSSSAQPSAPQYCPFPSGSSSTSDRCRSRRVPVRRLLSRNQSGSRCLGIAMGECMFQGRYGIWRRA